MVWKLERGAEFLPDGTVRFSVWAPRVNRLAVRFLSPSWTVQMDRHPNGLHTVIVQALKPGRRYYYILDNEHPRPDPVSRFQPEGVHGPSEIVDPRQFVWTDERWTGIQLRDVILYELHSGTFTPAGTFTAIAPYLDYLKNDLGVTAIELMPVAEFPGARNWGYDGTHLYAPHSAYGGPLGLKTLVNACHAQGLAVVLDVVYNHLGPEGNYLNGYGPYFTNRYQTPWGQAVNFDGDDSSEVRRYFIDNALYWVTEYHIDGLRLDAVHGIFDQSPVHILQDLAEAVHTQAKALDRTALVIAESDLNDNRVITDIKDGGWGFDAQWSDDFHHALHVLITGEHSGYYQDFDCLSELKTAITDGFVYQGQFSQHRQRPHGTPSRHLPGERFLICSQNHDQVGNRAHGERLSTLVSFAALKLAAGLVLCTPNIPLLFMGEEYGETAPFLYFTSHTDPMLAQSVREGRRREFSQFVSGEEIPDPQDPQTFVRSRLNHALREEAPYCALLRFYRDLIAVRKHSPALGNYNKEYLEVITTPERQALLMRRWQPQEETFLLLASFAAESVVIVPPLSPGRWQKVIDAAAEKYGGMGGDELPTVLRGDASHTIDLSPFNFALYRCATEV
jgi:maltooligosyltrehalose trehalohydrolase